MTLLLSAPQRKMGLQSELSRSRIQRAGDRLVKLVDSSFSELILHDCVSVDAAGERFTRRNRELTHLLFDFCNTECIHVTFNRVLSTDMIRTLAVKVANRQVRKSKPIQSFKRSFKLVLKNVLWANWTFMTQLLKCLQGKMGRVASPVSSS